MALMTRDIGGQGVGIGNYGGAIQQALLYQKFPDGRLTWGGRTITRQHFSL